MSRHLFSVKRFLWCVGRRGYPCCCTNRNRWETAAFTLPVLTRLMGYANSSLTGDASGTCVLVLTPTRELADQVADSVRQYSQHSQLRYAVLFGGVSIDPQKEQLRRGIEIVVVTPVG